MYGQGIAKGLWVTFKHFLNTYAGDVARGGRETFGTIGDTEFERRQSTKAQGIFTVEYPDEKIAVPDRFRFMPFLVVENYDHPERPGHPWCTSCGICAKVCPPQCIWIVRGDDPQTGRPIPEPQAFYIDIDICMNCGFCAEFCPFDAIKMDHDYELSTYDRTSNNIYDMEKLSKEMRYWVSIAPTTATEEAEARGGWEHPDIIKERKKAAKAGGGAAAPAAKANPPVTGEQAARSEAAADVAATVQATERAEATQPEPAAAGAADAEAAAKAERLAKREAALARKRAQQQGGGE